MAGCVRVLPVVRERRCPVFAGCVSPRPGGRGVLDAINQPVRCGGVLVSPGDIVVADEEGIVVVPLAQADDVLKRAQARAAKDAAESLEVWEAAHRARIDEILRGKGFTG